MENEEFACNELLKRKVGRLITDVLLCNKWTAEPMDTEDFPVSPNIEDNFFPGSEIEREEFGLTVTQSQNEFKLFADFGEFLLESGLEEQESSKKTRKQVIKSRNIAATVPSSCRDMVKLSPENKLVDKTSNPKSKNVKADVVILTHPIASPTNGKDLKSPPALKTKKPDNHTQLSSDVKKPKKIYKCSNCRKQFVVESNFNRHLITAHGDSKTENEKAVPSTVLAVNKNAFIIETSMINGTVILRKSPPNEKHQNAHECDICGKKYKRKWNLTDHMRKIHLQSKGQDLGLKQMQLIKRYECATCGNSYATENNLIRHQSKHSIETVRLKLIF